MSVTEHPDGPPDWWVYRGTGRPPHDIDPVKLIPAAPPWRRFADLPESDVTPPDDGEASRRIGTEYHLSGALVDTREVEMVNAALYLRRPLLVTGRPGSGKSSIAYKIARELGLGRVLRWPITSHTTLRQGLYEYDAIARAQAAGSRLPSSGERNGATGEPPIGEFIRLGQLGTAFLPRRRPRVLLIDELDKSDSELPDDLLSLFEDGEFDIPELARAARRTSVVDVFTADRAQKAEITDGVVRCAAFPVVVITSNGEREFPPAFLRRCLRFETGDPDMGQLAAMVASHALNPADSSRPDLVAEFVERSAALGGLPSDKLLEAVFLATSGVYRKNDESWQRLMDALWRQLNSLVP
ncbi:MoxR family ATPase [Amycolatopsis sp. CA-128772]|uniref:AAA family ATPase n=1 Tax=Amycolatopsis sp. CA-128772 TaxID=2073159 RepID=UPI000CD20A80|nr:AAA family ATPase [Amycolatopsis sp. CA-128772]